VQLSLYCHSISDEEKSRVSFAPVENNCIEGTERRQLAFRSADIYCQNINNPKCTLAFFYMQNGKKKEGETGKQPERQRKRESASV
jgi:hypothetical protein